MPSKMPRKPPQPIFYIKNSNAKLVADILREFSIECVTSDVENQRGVTEFKCAKVDDAILMKVIERIPPEAHAYTAIVLGSGEDAS